MNYILIEERTLRGYYKLVFEHKGVTVASDIICTVDQWADKLGVLKESFTIK